MKRVLLLITFLFVHLTADAQKSLLWEISGNGLIQPSYLFGTIHIICPTDFLLSDSVANKLASTKQMVLEMNTEDPTMPIKMQQMMAMKGGKDLKDLVSEQDYHRLDNYFIDSVNINIAMFTKNKPIFLMSLLYVKLLGCLVESTEMALVKQAKKQQKEIIGLETIEEQMAIFDKIPYETQAKVLVNMVKKSSQVRREFKDFLVLYKSQDIEEIAKTINSSEFDFNGYEDDMLNNRNQRWIPLIEKITKNKSSFIAVGAGHLGGKKGVLNLLRKAGYKVMPIL